MRYDTFLERVADRAFIESADTAAATHATLATLGERLTEGEALDVSLHLPEELKRSIEAGGGGGAQAMSLEDFVGRVAQREATSADVARVHARAVMTTLREAIHKSEFDDLFAQLSDEYKELLIGAESSGG